MKFITFPGAGMLAGLAQMLTHFGIETDDRGIALCMEAPYLLLHDDGKYIAGSGLYQPKWLDLFLQPKGLRMAKITLPKDEICPYLRAHAPAMLRIRIDKTHTHPVVYEGYADGRYLLTNIKKETYPEPDTFSLTSAMLKRRLEDEVTLYALERCAPQPVDSVSLLFRSLHTLEEYQSALLTARNQTVSQEELKPLHASIFRALMTDMLPMALLRGDPTLAEELRLLQHDYTHLFYLENQKTVTLCERLPKFSIQRCLLWMREGIVDRLYELGADEHMLDDMMDGK